MTEKIVNETLKDKIKQHNDSYGKEKNKEVNLEMLNSVFKRAIGIYTTDRKSIKIPVVSGEQWGLARVNAFLFDVRTGKFRGGQFDIDLLPTGHTLRN